MKQEYVTALRSHSKTSRARRTLIIVLLVFCAFATGTGRAKANDDANLSLAPTTFCPPDTVKGPDYDGYLDRLNQRVRSRWHAPKEAAGYKIIIEFSIETNGNCSALKVVQDGGASKSAVKSAINAIIHSAPFPPIPDPEAGHLDATYTFTNGDVVIRELTNSIAANPQNAEAYFKRGQAYLGRSAWTKAINDLTNAIRIRPTAEAFAERGVAYLETKQREKAQSDFINTLRLDPANDTPSANLWRFSSWVDRHAQISEKELQAENNERLHELDARIKLKPEEPFLYWLRARIWDSTRQQWKAIADLNTALNLQPRLCSAYVERAEIFSKMALHENAIADLTIATRLRPKDASLYDARGRQLALARRFAEAMQDYELAFELDPENAGQRMFAWIEGTYREPFRYMYIDKSGKKVVEKSFAWYGAFSEGLAPVKVGKLFGYIDSSGRMVIKPQFTAAGEFSEGLALASRDNAEDSAEYWGFIDKTGSFVVKPKFRAHQLNRTQKFSEGMMPISIGYRYGFIDTHGNLAIKPLFEKVRSFCEGLALVRLGTKYGYIDKSGKLAIDPLFELAGDFSHGLAPAMVLPNSAILSREGMTKTSLHMPDADRFKPVNYGFIAKDGRFAIEPKFELEPEELAGFVRGWSEGFDKAGKPIYEVTLGPEKYFLGDVPGVKIFDFIAAGFSDRLAPARIGNKFGYISTSGTFVIPPKFDAAAPFSDGLAAVSSGGKYGFIQESGRMTITPQFEKAEPFNDGRALVGKKLP